MTDTEIEQLVEAAKGGDSSALEELVRRVQDHLYGLALRMLWHPDDAADATQEILVKLITHLSSFRGESAFTTWAYRVAANHLLTLKKQRAEREEITFEMFGEQLDRGLTDALPPSAETVDRELLEAEMKIGCTHGMLLCLDREQRLAYILGDVFTVPGPEAAVIAGVSPEAFRQRLSRARAALRDFMRKKCGLVNADAACRCARRISAGIRHGRIDPKNLLFAKPSGMKDSVAALQQRVQEMEDLHQTAAIYQSTPEFQTPGRIAHAVKELIHSGRFRLLD